MKVVGVIPARYGSSRFPGKPLAEILGKPLIQWVLEAARGAWSLDEVWVATDDPRIARVVKHLQGQVVMTPAEVPSGTDRVFLAIRDKAPDIVVNIQGDEPLLQSEMINTLVTALLENEKADLATLAYWSPDPGTPDQVKIALSDEGYALYFSRSPIPYFREGSPEYWIHIGLYAYRFEALKAFVERKPTRLEQAEKLEQLRALDLGMRILVVPVKEKLHPVDRPEDIPVVEHLLKLRLP